MEIKELAAWVSLRTRSTPTSRTAAYAGQTPLMAVTHPVSRGWIDIKEPPCLHFRCANRLWEENVRFFLPLLPQGNPFVLLSFFRTQHVGQKCLACFYVLRYRYFLRGRAGLIVIQYVIFSSFWKNMYFPQQLCYFQYNSL